MKSLLRHREVVTPLNITVLSCIVLHMIGLHVTATVVMFNPYVIQYLSKCFRKV